MEFKKQGYFYNRLQNIERRYPLIGQIELTYRCNLNCVHCYCKGSENKNKELPTNDFKRIIKEIHKCGCIFLCFTGGEPLIRDDFLEIYSYARQKGFIITLFTNGLLMSGKILSYLKKFPPHGIEITINGITKPTYESVSRVEGSFEIMMDRIKQLRKDKFNLLFKSNCLKQNRAELAKIKAFTDKFLGKKYNRWKFKYDIMIYPRLNGDMEPCKFRLTPLQLLNIKKSESDMWEEYKKGCNGNYLKTTKNENHIYTCTSWSNQFFINPYGRLKFCQFSNKFSSNLKTNSFADGFYYVFPRVVQETFKTNSKCKNCNLRPICYYCPARAKLENGHEEKPVNYYCAMAKMDAKKII